MPELIQAVVANVVSKPACKTYKMLMANSRSAKQNWLPQKENLVITCMGESIGAESAQHLEAFAFALVACAQVEGVGVELDV